MNSGISLHLLSVWLVRRSLPAVRPHVSTTARERPATSGSPRSGSACAHLETSVALAHELGDRSARVASLNNLALAHRHSGDLARARDLTIEALTECEPLGDRHRSAALHNNLADIYRAQGSETEAMRHLKRAVRLFSEIGEANEPEVWKLVEW